MSFVPGPHREWLVSRAPRMNLAGMAGPYRGELSPTGGLIEHLSPSTVLRIAITKGTAAEGIPTPWGAEVLLVQAPDPTCSIGAADITYR
jgi:hypothetical protein